MARGGYIKAIMYAFPEIGLDETKFQRVPGTRSRLQHLLDLTFFLVGYYNDINIRRDAFIQFAKANNFDPLLASNWYFSRRKSLIESVPTLCILVFVLWNLPLL